MQELQELQEFKEESGARRRGVVQWRDWRGAALDRDLRSRAVLSSARKRKDGFKQAAPANYCTRCFAQRSVRRLFIRVAGRQT